MVRNFWLVVLSIEIVSIVVTEDAHPIRCCMAFADIVFIFIGIVPRILNRCITNTFVATVTIKIDIAHALASSGLAQGDMIILLNRIIQLRFCYGESCLIIRFRLDSQAELAILVLTGIKIDVIHAV